MGEELILHVGGSTNLYINVSESVWLSSCLLFLLSMNKTYKFIFKPDILSFGVHNLVWYTTEKNELDISLVK